MPSLLPRAADGLYAFAIGAAALTGSAANAQADPFALPKSATAATVQSATSGPGLSEIEIDGRVQARMVELRGTDAALTIDADDARAAGLPVADLATGQVRLDALSVYTWRFDALRQRLVVRLLRKSDGPNLRDFAMRDNALAERRTIAALRIDYDLNFAVSRSRTHLAGLVSGAFVKGDLAVVTSARVATAEGGRPAQAQRLDSFVQLRVPSLAAVATAGDFISAGSASQRPVRMGGLQLASDFSHQPDLVTSPMPAFSGSVAVPTSLDILTADQRYDLGQLEPGEFTIRNIPTNPGRGSMAVLLKDSLGREVVRTVSFYQSSTLLRPGLQAYAVNAGFVRRRYGIEGDHYGPFAASAYYRRGLSPFLTVEGSGEATSGLLNLGARGDFTIGNVALSSVEVRGSHDAGAGSGALVNAALESIGRRFSARAGFSYPTANYRDVASRLGDRPPTRQYFANIGFDLGHNMPLQLSYVRQESSPHALDRRTARRSEILSANLFYSPNARMNLSLNAGMRQNDRRSFFVGAGLTMRIGARHGASVAASRTGGQSLSTLAYQYNDHQNSGLRAQATIGTLAGDARITASAIHEGRWTMLNGGMVATAGRVSGQLSATGSLIATGGTVYARGQSADGYALVRAGDVEGIPVKVENRFVGTTDRRGRLLVQNLRAMVPQQIAVDGTRLPADAVVLTSRHVISVPQRAIGLVEIDAMYFRPVILSVVDVTGEPLDAGRAVTALPSGRETLVGFDGTVEFNTASGDRALSIRGYDGDCRVEIAPGSALEGAAALVCQPITTVAAAPSPATDRPPERRVARRN